MFLIDTNVLSEMRKFRGGRADARVVEWVRGQRLSDCYLSVITILELKVGVLRHARKDAAQAKVYQDWLHRVLEVEFRDRILPVDLDVASRCAALHVPDPRPDRDALIAATALAHGFTVATRNTKDLAPMGVLQVNPWD